MSTTTLLPFQPEAMSPAQLAAVSYLARYSGHTQTLYAYQLRRWFGWCETNGLDPLRGFSVRTSSCISGTLASLV
jgi:integrase/recombinase XerD